MAPSKKENNDDIFVPNSNIFALSEAIKEVAVMISKTDIRLENIKSQQDESIKKIGKIEDFINNFNNLENKIKIIEQKDIVIINKEIEDLKNDLHAVKSYVDDIYHKIENHKTKIWEVRGDTKEMKIFNDNLKSNIKFYVELFMKSAIGIFVSYALYKMGWNK